jgi:ribose transport system permease protein
MKSGVPRQILSSIWKALKEFPVVLILIVFFAAFSVLFPDRFLSQLNFAAMMRQFVTLMLFAVGPSMVMTMGSLDLTYVGIWMLGGALLWFLFPVLGIAAILVVPLLGVVTGFMVGVIQARAKIPSFILTLSIMFTYWGLTALISGGYPRTVQGLGFITAKLIPVIPTALLWALPILAAAIYVIKCTRFGTYLYALGSNEEGAHLAGINVLKYKIMAFTVSGLFTGIGSMILFQHMGGSVAVEMNLNTMNWPLVAIILGGTPLMGGSGGPQRTILGALTLTVLVRGLNVAMLKPEAIQLLVGLMLIASILVGSRSANKGGVEVS